MLGTVDLIDRNTVADVGLKRRPIKIGTATFVEKAHAHADRALEVFGVTVVALDESTLVVGSGSIGSFSTEGGVAGDAGGVSGQPRNMVQPVVDRIAQEGTTIVGEEWRKAFIATVGIACSLIVPIAEVALEQALCLDRNLGAEGMSSPELGVTCLVGLLAILENGIAHGLTKTEGRCVRKRLRETDETIAAGVGLHMANLGTDI